MKKLILLILISITAMALLPLIASLGKTPVPENNSTREAAAEPSIQSPDKQNSSIEPSQPPSSENTPPESSKNNTENTKAVFKIFDTSSGEVVTVPDREFCIGALAYELPPSAEPEALKAQCVACYTHFCRLREQQKANPDEELHGADWAADLSADEFYLSDDAMKKKWGDLYKTSRQQLEQAADDCTGLVLTDSNGVLIDAAYHAMSGGVTESAADIFGKEDPHLQPVASPWDKAAEDYCTTKKISEKDFVRLLTAENKSLSEKDILAETKFNAVSTDSGAVKTITIAKQSFSGASVRSIFSLRSAHFTLRHVKKQFVFTVYGYGHGVGMSQVGAEGMAAQGATFREILLHYYTDTTIRPYRPE